MQKLPKVEKYNRHYSTFLLHALAFESFDFSDFDVVLSVSARYAHGIITKPSTKHVCYMNSPGRMFWESQDYFKEESFGKLDKIAKSFLKFPLMNLRLWDYTAAQRVDYFIANSKTPQARIKKYYGRDSVIVYPFVNHSHIKEVTKNAKDEGYFLVISRLLPWKRIDLIVKACNNLGLPLKIIGEGPALEELKSIYGTDAQFLGYVSEDEKIKYIAGCTAVIQAQLEDFGIVPLEVMSAGKPVICYGKGGVLETVIPGKTGEFFMHQTVEDLVTTLKRFDSTKYLQTDCRIQAKKFDKGIFVKNMKEFVNAVYLEGQSQ